MSKKDVVETIDENDFGFSFVGEDEINQQSEVEDLRSRITQLRSMFLPLLVNLNKNPDKEMIKWPNRKELLDKQIEKLKQLTNI